MASELIGSVGLSGLAIYVLVGLAFAWIAGR